MMTNTEIYYKSLTETLDKIHNTQTEAIAQTAKQIARTIENDGIIYVFGCGHSHLIAGDAFYRAGGLANVCAMFDTDLMLHNGAAKSSALERMEGIAKHIYRRYAPTEKDALIVISTSGINSVPIEMASLGKANGVFTAASALILNSILVEAAGIAAAKVKPPIYMSGNVEGGAEYNEALIERYTSRIKHL